MAKNGTKKDFLVRNPYFIPIVPTGRIELPQKAKSMEQ